jgi:3-hydroxybutyryl-CoA dehydrogenase
MESIVTAEDIDSGAKLGYGHPIGHSNLAGLTDPGTVMNVVKTLYHGFSDSDYRSCPRLPEEMLLAGCLGKKRENEFVSIYDL